MNMKLHWMRRLFKYEDNIVIESYICGREFFRRCHRYEALPIIEIAPVEGLL